MKALLIALRRKASFPSCPVSQRSMTTHEIYLTSTTVGFLTMSLEGTLVTTTKTRVKEKVKAIGKRKVMVMRKG